MAWFYFEKWHKFMCAHLSQIVSCLVLAICSMLATSVSASAINHVETYTNNVNGVTGLLGISDVAVSADGKFVYTASYQASALSVFERDPATGRLTYRSTNTGVSAAFSVDVSPDNKSVYAASPTGSVVYAFSRDIATGALTSVGSASGSPTGGFVSVSVSPDSKTVYGVGGSPSGLVAFSRDMNTGAIARVADYADNTNGHALGQVFSPTGSPIKNIAFSANGQFVYVTSTIDNAISLFSRDTATGALTQQAVYVDNVAGVDGLQAASSVKITPDGDYLYVSGQGESSIAIFRVDRTDGRLTYIDKVTHGVGGVSNLQGVRSLAISPDGKYVYASAISSSSVTAFDRDPATGLLTFNAVAINGVNGLTNMSSPSGMATDPSSSHLYVAGQVANSLVAFALPTPVVRLSVAQTTAAFNGGASILDPQLQVFDADSTNLTSATVSISQGFVSTDLLTVQTAPGITASYNAGTGVLTLTGTASLADYQAVLRTLSFRSGADPSVPVGGFSTRTITFTVSDGANTSAISSIAVKVGPAGGLAAPTAVTAIAGDTQATIAFAAPPFTGGAPITGYTVTSSPGGLTGTGAGSPVIVSGLTNGTAYTFTVTATNAAGPGLPSLASNSITPATTVTGTVTGGNASATAATTDPVADPNCRLASAQFTSKLPPGALLSYGTFEYLATGCSTAVTITLNYPQPLPLNVKFMKYGPKTAGASTREWFEWTGPLVLSNNRQTVSYTVADGGVGDSDPAPGRIADPIAPVIFAAGPGGPVTSIPVDAPWALALLSALMGGLAWRRQRAVQG